MIERKIDWACFRKEFRRLKFLPGYDRVEEEHWAEWYTEFAEGYFPHELHSAVGAVLFAPDTQFFPPPGKVMDYISKNRRSAGGNDWDSTLRALTAEAERYEQRYLAPPKAP